MTELFSPSVENLGKNCKWWRDGRGCCYPKAEVQGRPTCEGLIDDICIYLVRKIRLKSLTNKRLMELKLCQVGAATN